MQTFEVLNALNTVLLVMLLLGWIWRSKNFWAASDFEAKKQEIQNRVAGIQEIAGEMGATLIQQRLAVEATLKRLEELSTEMKLLSVNGSIEASRNAESFRAFHGILQEINRLSEKSQTLIHELSGNPKDLENLKNSIQRIDSILRKVANDGRGGSSASSAAG